MMERCDDRVARAQATAASRADEARAAEELAERGVRVSCRADDAGTGLRQPRLRRVKCARERLTAHRPAREGQALCHRSTHVTATGYTTGRRTRSRVGEVFAPLKNGSVFT